MYPFVLSRDDREPKDAYSPVPRAKNWEDYDEGIGYFVYPPRYRPPNYSRPQSSMAADGPFNTPDKMDEPSVEKNISQSKGQMAALVIVPEPIAKMSGALSKCYKVSNSAELSIEARDDIQAIFQSLPVEHLLSAAKMAVAAVALHIPTNSHGTISCTSGFRVGESTIVSCAHFHKWDSNNNAQYLNMYTGNAPQSEVTFTQGQDSQSNFCRGRVLLRGLNRNEEISVREIRSPRYVPSHVNRTTEFLPLDVIDGSRAVLASSTHCFSAGYNVDVNSQLKNTLLGDHLKTVFSNADDKTKFFLKQWGVDPTSNPDKLVGCFNLNARSLSLGAPSIRRQWADMALTLAALDGMVGLVAWLEFSITLAQSTLSASDAIVWGGKIQDSQNQMIALDGDRLKWLQDVFGILRHGDGINQYTADERRKMFPNDG